MSKKIAAVDAENMNQIYSSEYSRIAKREKVADLVVEKDLARSADPQAFKDHDEYLAVLEEVIKEDKKSEGSFDQNDVVLD